MLLPLLALALLSEGVYTAPLVERVQREVQGESEDVSEQLYNLLKEGLLNNTNDVEILKDKFNQQLLCISLTYAITCTDEKECENATTIFNCSTGYTSALVWLSFDPTTMAGKFLLANVRLNIIKYIILYWELIGGKFVI